MQRHSAAVCYCNAKLTNWWAATMPRQATVRKEALPDKVTEAVPLQTLPTSVSSQVCGMVSVDQQTMIRIKAVISKGTSVCGLFVGVSVSRLAGRQTWGTDGRAKR
jgi:hypothetical protein